MCVRRHEPEEAEGDLEDAREEGDGEDQRPVGRRVGGRVDDLLHHGRQQQRHDGDGPDGDLPRRPHHGVDQRRHHARVYISSSENLISEQWKRNKSCMHG